MTREEILAKRIITFPEEGHMLDSDIKRNVYAAMSEFAQQEVVAATHPLQEKIDGLREALEQLVDYTNGIPREIAEKALETYK